jgi:hypothetical protein
MVEALYDENVERGRREELVGVESTLLGRERLVEAEGDQ